MDFHSQSTGSQFTTKTFFLVVVIEKTLKMVKKKTEQTKKKLKLTITKFHKNCQLSKTRNQNLTIESVLNFKN